MNEIVSERLTAKETIKQQLDREIFKRLDQCTPERDYGVSTAKQLVPEKREGLINALINGEGDEFVEDFKPSWYIIHLSRDEVAQLPSDVQEKIRNRWENHQPEALRRFVADLQKLKESLLRGDLVEVWAKLPDFFQQEYLFALEDQESFAAHARETGTAGWGRSYRERQLNHWQRWLKGIVDLDIDCQASREQGTIVGRYEQQALRELEQFRDWKLKNARLSSGQAKSLWQALLPKEEFREIDTAYQLMLEIENKAENKEKERLVAKLFDEIETLEEKEGVSILPPEETVPIGEIVRRLGIPKEELDIQPEAEFLTSDQVVKVFDHLIAKIGASGWQAEINEQPGRMKVNKKAKRIFVKPDEEFRPSHLFALAHEFVFHVLRSLNGENQNYFKLSRGTRGYLATEEGGASMLELMLGLSRRSGCFIRFPARYLAVYQAEKAHLEKGEPVADYSCQEIYWFLRSYGIEKRPAARIVFRVLRGTDFGRQAYEVEVPEIGRILAADCYNKDRVYYQGLLLISEYLREKLVELPQAPWLVLSKTTLEPRRKIENVTRKMAVLLSMRSLITEGKAEVPESLGELRRLYKLTDREMERFRLALAILNELIGAGKINITAMERLKKEGLLRKGKYFYQI